MCSFLVRKCVVVVKKSPVFLAKKENNNIVGWGYSHQCGVFERYLILMLS